jgi:hypothetical protein
MSINLTHSIQKDKSIKLYFWMKHLVTIKLCIYDITLTSIPSNEKHIKIQLF